LQEHPAMTTGFRIAVCVLGVVALATAYHIRTVAERIVAFDGLRERLGGVEGSDGIQADEADVIASEYSQLLLGQAAACSGTTSPTFVDGQWKAEILFGYGGERTGRWISIDPVRGGVASPGGPRYPSFAWFRLATLVGVFLQGR
jgi:hypothetical protein